MFVNGLMLVIAGLVLLSGVLYLIPGVGKYLAKLAKILGGFQTIIGIIAIILAIWDMLSAIRLENVFLLISGLVLAAGILPMIPAIGDKLVKAAKILAGFMVPIGIIALILGILELLA